MKNFLVFILWGILACLLSACASTITNAHRQKEPMMAAYNGGNMTQALELAQDKVSDNVDEIMWRLEIGRLNFLLKNDNACLKEFERIEELTEDYDSRAVVNIREISAEGGSLLVNPNTLPYTGLCRDRILVPVYKGLSYLGKGDEEGFKVEMFRLRKEQNRIADKYHKVIAAEEEAVRKEKQKNAKVSNASNMNRVLSDKRNAALNQSLQESQAIARKGYGNFLNPLAIFLSGYAYARDNDYQNAVVDFGRLYKVMPHNPLVQQYYATALSRTGRTLPPFLKNTAAFNFDIGKDNILVIMANGQTGALKQIAISIPVILPGYVSVASAAWPICEYYQPFYSGLSVQAENTRYNTIQIADMDGILSQEYHERLPGQLTRMILGVVLKEAASYFAVRAANQAHPAAGLAVAIGAAIYKIAVNTADTRSWEILPKEYQITQFAMPSDHTVKLDFGNSQPIEIHIPEKARSAIIYVSAPGGQAPVVCRVLPLSK